MDFGYIETLNDVGLISSRNIQKYIHEPRKSEIEESGISI